MKNAKRYWTLIVCCVWAVSPVLADEVAQPWGTMNANIAGTASADHPSMVFSSGWASGAAIDWELDVRALGVDRPQTGAVTFDEDGNVYWKGSSLFFGGNSARVASVSPAGTLRWAATDSDGTTAHQLGAFDTTSVVVGDGGAAGRVYAIGNTAAGAVAVAYAKATGVKVWETPLPGTVFPGRDGNLTPVLYQGKLYVKSSGANPMLYQLESATGAINWSNAVAGIPAIGGDFEGGMTLVPNAFGAGAHGLYFNGTSGNGSDGVAEMYAVKLDTNANAASLAWSDDGGHVNRSHVIDVAAAGRVCTHTWTDFGAEFYCWNYDGTGETATNNIDNSGHGFYDVGCVDFDGNDVLAGGFNGRISRYVDVNAATGVAGTGYYQLESWYGEPRVYGGLYKDTAGNSILVTATNSRTDLDPTFTSRVVAVDVTNGTLIDSCEDFNDGPAYIDNLVITGGPDPATQNIVHVDVAGFEGYTVGDLPGQANTGGSGSVTWVTDNQAPSGITPVQVVADPTGSGMGNVIMLDADKGCGGWHGIFAQLAAAASDAVVNIKWKQWRADVDDNLHVADHPDFAAWYAVQQDTVGGIWAKTFGPHYLCGTTTETPAVPLTPGVWQEVRYEFDNEFGIVSLYLDGVCVAEQDITVAGNQRGVAFELEGTQFTRSTDAQTTPVFTHITNSVANHGFAVRGGPLMGPTAPGQTQHIYYFNTGDGKLVALKPAATSVCSRTVANRQLFYANSAWGATPVPNTSGQAGNKVAKLPGTGPVTFENVSSHSRGINGIYVDLQAGAGCSALSLTAADFTFKYGNSSNIAGWATAPDPTVTVQAGAGAGGSDRVVLTWADNAIPNKNWLQVTVLANANTGLAANDVFYFGNLIGEVGDVLAPPARFTVTSTDYNAIYNNRSATPVPNRTIVDVYDMDRSKVVNSTDYNNYGYNVRGTSPLDGLTVITP